MTSIPLAKQTDSRRSISGRGPFLCAAFLGCVMAPKLAFSQTCLEWKLQTIPALATHGMAYDSARGVMVLYGGSTGNGTQDETWEFDGATGRWTLRATTGPTAHGSFAICFDSARGVTVVFGGSVPGTPNGETWEWNDASWTLRSSVGPAPRYGSGMTFDSARGVSVLFGGDLTGPQGGENGETWEWDGETWMQRPIAGPPPRSGHRIAYDPLRDVTVLYGGSSWSNGVTTYYHDTWEYDGHAGVWTQRATTGPDSSVLHAMCYDGASQTTMLFGGYGPGYLNQTWSWSGNVWTLVSASGPSPRRHHAMAFDSQRNLMIMMGGANDQRYESDTWEWNGRAWNLVAQSPSPRSQFAMAYDPDRQAAVLFGGYIGGAQPSGDTWEWSQNPGESGVWTQRNVAGPSARKLHAMSYFESRDVTVLFGGSPAGGETWEWDGNAQTWTQRFIPSPSPRAGHAMVYDSTRQVLVLFGGSWGGLLGDTWEYDGRQWTQVATTGPSPRTRHAMAYDPVRMVTVLFGGHDNPSIPTGYNSETWEYDGSTSAWTQRIVAGPPAREAHAMTYDPIRAKVILIGGWLPSGQWEWDGATWTTLSLGAPTNRYDHSIVFDSLNQHVLVFGGNIVALCGDTWGLPQTPVGDINCDQLVNITDLLAVINAWGACPLAPAPCPADITADGEVNVDDLLMVITNWRG